MEATTDAPAAIDPRVLEEWDAGYLRAWNDHDADAVARHCTEDVVWDDPSLAQPLHGHDGVRAFVEATTTAFPDFRVEELDPPVTVPGRSLVLSRYRLTGTMLGPWTPGNFAPTGARISIEGVDAWTFRGARMCAYTTHYDSVGMARQLGVMPPAGSSAERAMARLQHAQAWFQRRRAARGDR